MTTMAKILGAVWNPETDQLTYRVNENAISKHLKVPGYAPTKRELLSTIMRIFDPLGHAAHVLVRGKILLQKAWKASIGWDDAIPDELTPEWHEWLDTVQQLNRVEIPRHYAPLALSQAENELHIFTDATLQNMRLLPLHSFEPSIKMRHTCPKSCHVKSTGDASAGVNNSSSGTDSSSYRRPTGTDNHKISYFSNSTHHLLDRLQMCPNMAKL